MRYMISTGLVIGGPGRPHLHHWMDMDLFAAIRPDHVDHAFGLYRPPTLRQAEKRIQLGRMPLPASGLCQYS